MTLRASPNVLAAIVGLLLACRTGGDFRDDVLYCEESVAHLMECCPGFDPTAIRCRFSEEKGCYDDDRTTRYPAIEVEDGRCLLEKTCAELTPSICARAQAAKPRYTCRGWLCDEGPSSSRPPVCS